ncbi:hypothetical protein ACF0H5_020400 [Mactra antiquata]
MELDVLLDALRFCEECGLGPVPLTAYSVANELKRGLSGYLYVKCSYEECGHVNKVPYGKSHWVKGTGAPSFVVNTRKKRSAGYLVARQEVSAARKRLDDRFKCKTRKGMSCAIDTPWQKRGFDSLSCM